jgi:hypothetical protein
MLHTNGIEETIDLEVPFFICDDVLDTEVVQEVTIALALSGYSIPQDGLEKLDQIILTAEGK